MECGRLEGLDELAIPTGRVRQCSKLANRESGWEGNLV